MLTAEILYERLKRVKLGTSTCVYTMKKCEQILPLINQINVLKKEKNAVILTHSYVSPEIIYSVGDFVGDSYKLSQDALATNADVIVFAAVRFMAETAKILSPHKEVLIPSQNNGCTLADSITGEKVRCLRQEFKGYTFVCYINTTVDVKAECDVCVTSSNVYDVVESIENDRIYFLPDKLMGKNLQNEMKMRGCNKDIQIYHGTCYVHEEYDPDMIDYIRMEFPKVKVVSHPECSPEIIEHSDFVGSTAQMMSYVKRKESSQYLMLTECGLSARLQVEMPEVEFVGSCTMCRYMKSNTLEGILEVLKNPSRENKIEIDEKMRKRSQACLEAMFTYVSKNTK